MDECNTPSTHQFHGIFLECISLLESSGFPWKIQGCTIYNELFIKVIQDVGVDSSMKIIIAYAHVARMLA